ncbi:unnamed protein product [Rotaria sp. Silwood1]|nr:unnamed protein product [Rotaria sp. Silwood1]CAF4863655.1 unnamed protein product [Rotaria sp. Silwood1]CAF4948635.1 unnamed protein product [Rotaria sp. Silwood1]
MDNNFQQSSIYESPSNNYYAQPIYSSEYGQIQSFNNMDMNTQQQMYQTTTQQPSSIYQSQFQQPPPTYATALQSSSYPVPMQQQLPPVNGNQNLSTKNPTGPEASPAKGFEWPRKSVSLVCPKCGASVSTRVETKNTLITLAFVLIFCCVTCILFWIPLCVSSSSIPTTVKSSSLCASCVRLKFNVFTFLLVINERSIVMHCFRSSKNNVLQ